MDLDSIIITAFITLMAGGLGSLFWSRLNRIESNMATHTDSEQLREELAYLRSEQTVMRSDLTHIALAVGAGPKRASEG